MQQAVSLQSLLGIQSTVKYREFNILILLDKEKKDTTYPKKIRCYEEELEIL